MKIRQSTMRELTSGCPRKGILTLRYVHEGHEDVKFSPGRDGGTLGHAGIEAHINGKDYRQAIQDKMEELPQDDPEELASVARDVTLSLASVLSKVDDYLAGVDIVHVEHQWELDLFDHTLTGIWDLVLRDDQLGCIEVLDWKFRKQFTTLGRQDFQGRTYALAASRLLNVPAGYVVHFTHGTIKVNGRGPRAKPPFIRFDTVTYDLDELAAHQMHLELTPWTARTNSAAFTAPPVYNGECSWRCPFYQECGMLDQLRYLSLEAEAEYMQEQGWILREESNDEQGE